MNVKRHPAQGFYWNPCFWRSNFFETFKRCRIVGTISDMCFFVRWTMYLQGLAACFRAESTTLFPYIQTWHRWIVWVECTKRFEAGQLHVIETLGHEMPGCRCCDAHHVANDLFWEMLVHQEGRKQNQVSVSTNWETDDLADSGTIRFAMSKLCFPFYYCSPVFLGCTVPTNTSSYLQ